MDALLEKALLCWHAGDAGNVTREELHATCSLIKAVGYDVQISKRRCLGLFSALVYKFQEAQRQSEMMSRELAVEEKNIRELELKVRLLTHESVVV